MKNKAAITAILSLVFLCAGCATNVRYHPGNESIGRALKRELQPFGLNAISFDPEDFKTENWKVSRDAYGVQFIIEGNLIKEIKYSLGRHKPWKRVIDTETKYLIGEMNRGLVIQVRYHDEEDFTHLIILDKRTTHNQAEVSTPLAPPSLTT